MKKTITMLALAAIAITTTAYAAAPSAPAKPVAQAPTEHVKNLPLAPIVLAGMGCFLILSARRS